jgi:hypothetical protein
VVNVGTAMRPIFNQIWNALGQMGSEMFDAAGNWRGRDLA